MEEADDINRVVDDVDINGIDNNIDNSGESPEASGAVGGTAPEQLTKAQQATENELRRLGSRNPPGRREELGLLVRLQAEAGARGPVTKLEGTTYQKWLSQRSLGGQKSNTPQKPLFSTFWTMGSPNMQKSGNRKFLV